MHWFWYEQGEPLGIPGFYLGEGVPDQAQVILKGFTDNAKITPAYVTCELLNTAQEDGLKTNLSKHTKVSLAQETAG